MKQIKRLIVLLALAFILVLVPAVPAQAKKPLRCELEIELSWDPFQWEGTITGDIEGSFIITPDPEPSFPGTTEHFFETWVIETATGNIELFQEGVWSFKTFKWRSNGRITAASGTWMYLIGCNVHVRGVTTEFLGPPHPIYGTGTMQVCPNSH